MVVYYGRFWRKLLLEGFLFRLCFEFRGLDEFIGQLWLSDDRFFCI